MISPQLTVAVLWILKCLSLMLPHFQQTICNGSLCVRSTTGWLRIQMCVFHLLENGFHTFPVSFVIFGLRGCLIGLSFSALLHTWEWLFGYSQSDHIRVCISSLSVFWREEASASRINMEGEKRNKGNRSAGVMVCIQQGVDIFGHCRGTNYTQVTAELGVTLSNFYPIVCVHTSWLSYQYVHVFVW